MGPKRSLLAESAMHTVYNRYAQYASSNGQRKRSRAAGELGFGAEAEMRDRTQMQFVALLARQGAHRFILKGGMAMRALYGSTRLTKDVDFDGEGSLSQQSMQTQMPKALLQAARQAQVGLRSVVETTCFCMAFIRSAILSPERVGQAEAKVS
jgi:hypothetical protein